MSIPQSVASIRAALETHIANSTVLKEPVAVASDGKDVCQLESQRLAKLKTFDTKIQKMSRGYELIDTFSQEVKQWFSRKSELDVFPTITCPSAVVDETKKRKRGRPQDKSALAFDWNHMAKIIKDIEPYLRAARSAKCMRQFIIVSGLSDAFSDFLHKMYGQHDYHAADIDLSASPNKRARTAPPPPSSPINETPDASPVASPTFYLAHSKAVTPEVEMMLTRCQFALASEKTALDRLMQLRAKPKTQEWMDLLLLLDTKINALTRLEPQGLTDQMLWAYVGLYAGTLRETIQQEVQTEKERRKQEGRQQEAAMILSNLKNALAG